MTATQKIFALIAVICFFTVIVRSIRKGNLREEYSWIWFLTGLVMIVMVVWYDLLVLISKLIGASLPTTTLFLFGILFLMFVCLQFAVRISILTTQVKDLAQMVSLLEAEARLKETGGTE